MRSKVALAGIRPIAMLAVLLVSVTAGAFAQIGGPYDLHWNVIAGGGGTFSTGGSYSLGGTVGQYDAGQLSNGSLVLGGGFWMGGQALAGVGDNPIGPGGPGAPVSGLPLSFRLYPVTPNPASFPAGLTFDLPAATPVQLAVYDLTGARVSMLVDQEIPAGHHRIVWDGRTTGGRAAASGIYMIRIDAGRYQAQEKLIILK